MPPHMSSSSHSETESARFVHTISEAGRLLPSASQWNSIEIDFNLVPQSSSDYGSLPSRFSKSFEYELIITDKSYFKRFLYILVSVVLLILALILLVQLLPHKHSNHGSSKNLTLAVNQALTFFDAQKCNTSFPYHHMCMKIFLIIYFLKVNISFN